MLRMAGFKVSDADRRQLANDAVAALVNPAAADAAEVVEYARGPGDAETKDGRVAHPGGWGDITTAMARSYGFHVDAVVGGRVSVEFFNRAYYASFVERRGYWVVSGLDNEHYRRMTRRGGMRAV